MCMNVCVHFCLFDLHVFDEHKTPQQTFPQSTHTHTHTHTLTHAHTHTLIDSLSHTHTHTQAYTHTCPYTHTHLNTLNTLCVPGKNSTAVADLETEEPKNRCVCVRFVSGLPVYTGDVCWSICEHL